jgi:hypothetical protein
VIGNGLVSGMKAEILARINDGSFGASYREFSRNNGVLTPKHEWVLAVLRHKHLGVVPGR